MDSGEVQESSAVDPSRFGQGQPTGNAGWVPQSDFARSAAEIQHEPGSGWNNKKAREEYQRAAMLIEDKNFSLSMNALDFFRV